MSHETIAGALSRGRRSHTRIHLALAAFAAALIIVAALGAAKANAAFTATGYSMGASSTQAGGHPALTFNANIDPYAGDANGDDLSNLQLELPTGMLFNPQAIATPCPTADFNADKCTAPTQVGTISVSYRAGGKINTATGSVYSITPDSNSVINFGFVVRATTSFQKFLFKSGQATGLTTVRSGLDKDYGLTIQVPNIPRTIKSSIGINTSMTISNISITFNPRANATNSGGYFVFAPTRCDAANSRATFTSYAGVTQSFASGYVPTGCDQVKLTPTFSINSLNTAAGQPTGINATVTMPTGDQAIQQSHVRDVAVTLPEGTTVNLDVLNALDECSELYLSYDACPASSQIGTATVNVPFLPAPMTGKIYLTGSSPITFGYVLWGARNTYAILRGSAGISNGGVTAKFEMLPQVPWSSANMVFNSTLVNNPDYGCPNATSWAYVNGYSGASSIYGASYPQTNCPPPDTTITTSYASPINVKTPSFSFIATPATGATFKCKVDTAAWAPCTSPYTIPAVADGTHTFYARAFNSSGTGDFTPAYTKFTVDTVAPAINITTPTDGQVVASRSVTLNFTTEDGSTNYCRLDTGALPECGTSYTFTNVADGAHKIRVISRDVAGNISFVDRFFSVKVIQPPTVTMTTPANNSTLPTNRLTLDFAASSPQGTPLTKTICTFYYSYPEFNFEYEDFSTPCTNGQEFRLDENNNYRLQIDVTDANGLVGSASANFKSALYPPFAPFVVDADDVAAGRLTNRTPSFRLEGGDARYPNPTWECSLGKKGDAPVWTPCGSPSAPGTVSATSALANGDYRLWTRAKSGTIVGDAWSMDFSVGDWDAIYTASVSTTAAGAHPDLDVDITPNKAGQFRTIDMTLPKGMIGSLNSFPMCPRANVPTANCAANTKIGSVITDVQITGLTSLAPLDGDVFLTEPQVDGDVAGMVINVYSPVNPFADTIIPLRLQLINNSQTMRIFSDTIPTKVGDKYDPNKFTNFWVNDFKMHVDGSKGSPYPLLTNPSSCAAGQFNAVFGDTQGNKSPARQIAFQATGCDQLPLNAAFTQTFTNTAASGTTSTPTGVLANLTLPSGNSSIRRITAREPAAYAPNYPSFGDSADRCKPSSIVDTDPTAATNYVFTYSAANCPASAKAGTIRIASPLLTRDLIGDVYLVEAGSIPRFGVKVDQDGISLRMAGINRVDSSTCDETIYDGGCPDQVVVDFDNIPDLPLSGFELNLNQPDRQNAAGTKLLTSKLLVLAAPYDTYVCRPTTIAETTITSWSGVTQKISQPIALTGCDQP